MVRRWLSGLLAGAMVALAGCTIQPVLPATPVTQSQPAAPTAPPAATPIPTPAAAATLTPEETVAAQVIAALAEQTQLSPADMTVVSVEAVEWPDACLGVDNPDEMCAAVITPGFSVVIETPNGQYEVHTNADASSIRVASAPDTALVAPVIEWQQAGADCRRAVIGSDSLAVGTCAGTLVSGAFGSPARAGELAELTATFAPFTAETTAGAVVFHGEGVTAALPAEQRMIAEWARLAVLEATAGAADDTLGLAFAWHRQGGIIGHCDDLRVYLSGQAYAVSCRRDTNQRRLAADELARVFRWVDTLAPWGYREGDLMPADGMLTTMDFFGAGNETANAGDQRIALAFAERLWSELSQ